jgi:putative Ca2+/H+ antiporter (TMEM165/GDT1 family)
MEAFLVSTGVVALAEFGDKSQLLVLALAAKFRKPLPIILGMFIATLLNHVIAAEAGAWLGAMTGPFSMQRILGLSFLVIGIWMLVPDKPEEKTLRAPKFGVFGTTTIAFFLLEMGDKTQLATVALAAKYGSLPAVVAGSTVGILLADVPIVLLGGVAGRILPMRSVHKLAPVIFLVIGAIILVGPRAN